MHIDVSKIKASPGERMHLELEAPLPSLEAGGERVEFTGPARASLEVSNTGKALRVEGRVKAQLRPQCARCLEPFTLPVETEISETYYPEGGGEAGPEEREEWIPFSGDMLDITPEVLKSLMLVLPMRFVCREDCRGLCPRCGQNRNLASCDCPVEDVDPRLAVLKDFFKSK
ncbi:MAG: DUF177 domain-containing protein [Thermoanaerobacteraceae bacterium]|nr:DUF177 domain-containing protein [Thermoanaerobacteraceae bacterium]